MAANGREAEVFTNSNGGPRNVMSTFLYPFLPFFSPANQTIRTNLSSKECDQRPLKRYKKPRKPGGKHRQQPRLQKLDGNCGSGGGDGEVPVAGVGQGGGQGHVDGDVLEGLRPPAESHRGLA